MSIFKRTILLTFILISSCLAMASHSLKEFRLPGWPDQQVVIPEMSMLYRVHSMTPDGSAFVGDKIVSYLNMSSIRHYSFYYSVERGYLEILLPEGVTFQDPESSIGWAWDLTSDGQIVVGNMVNTEGRIQAFRYFVSEDRLELLGTFPGVITGDGSGTISHASGISSDGSVIVGKALDSDGRIMAFRWTEESGMQRVYGEGYGDYSLTWAMDVSADGSRICGFVRMADGSQKGFFQDNGGEIMPLSIPDGEGLFVMGKIFGEDNHMFGYGGRINGGQLEQVGIAWNDQEDYTIFPVISPESRIALFSVSEDLHIAAGEAYFGNVGWRPYIWTISDGPRWADEYVQSRFEVTESLSGLFRYAYVSEDGSALIMAGVRGVYLFDMKTEPSGSFQVFKSSLFTEQIRQSQWFGSMDVDNFPWAYHFDLGWLFILPDSREDSTICFYDLESGKWLSTSKAVYPAVYDMSSETWLWHLSGSRWFYDFSVADWAELKGD